MDVANFQILEKSKPKKTVNKGKKKKPEKLSEEEVKQPTEKRKRKKPDPYAPKRPLTSYMFFCNYRRELLKEENPCTFHHSLNSH